MFNSYWRFSLSQPLRHRVNGADNFHATLISPAHHTYPHALCTEHPGQTSPIELVLASSLSIFSFHNDVIQTILTLSTNKCQQLVNIYLQSRHLCWTLRSDTSVYSALPLEDLRDIQTLYLNVVFYAYSILSTQGSDTLTAASCSGPNLGSFP